MTLDDDDRNKYPELVGVQVQSTPRLFIEAFKSAALHDMKLRMDRVQYVTEEELIAALRSAVELFGLDAFATADRLCERLLLKRTPFAHENEVRLFLTTSAAEFSPICKLPIDPNTIFAKAMLDPRLKTFERREQEAEIRKVGFSGPIPDPELYRRILYEL